MARHRLTTTLGVLLALGVGACSSGSNLSDLRSREQLQLPDAGLIPYPILMDPDLDEPVVGPDGSYLPSWDGTLAELLAVDAYASCALGTSKFKYNVAVAGFPTGFPAGNDEYLNHLVSLSKQHLCADSGPVSQPFPIQWLNNRRNKECNVQPLTGMQAGVEFNWNEVDNEYESFHHEFADDWQDYTSDIDVYERAHTLAAAELEYASLNLCIAQKLRSQLNGDTSIFVSTDDQVEILTIIKERAQLSALYFALLGKLFASQQASSTTVDAGDLEFLVLMRKWAEGAGPAVLIEMGEEFAAAVNVLLETTYDLAGELQRLAATRPVSTRSGVDGTRAARDWGLGQPRMRLLNILYGGEPSSSPLKVMPPGYAGGGARRNGSARAFVHDGSHDPLTGELLGLARSSDAIRLLVTEQGGEPAGIDAPSSAEHVYKAVELALRVESCERETPGDPACAPATVSSGIPDVDETSEFLLWQEHGIELEHARTLTSSLADALRDAVVAKEDPHGSAINSPLHVTGNHTLEEIEGDSWLHVDPEFRALGLQGHELAQDFLAYAMLPLTIDTTVDARNQGFASSTSQATQQGLVWVWEEQRALGLVGALAFVREAIVMGESAPSFASFFFTGARAALPGIEAAIGTQSGVIRRGQRKVNYTCNLGEFVPGSTCTRLDFNTGAPTFTLDVVTTSDDQFDRLVVTDPSPQLPTLARSAASSTINGVTRATLDALSGVSPSSTAFAEGRVLRTFPFGLEDGFTPRKGLLLRSDQVPEELQYLFVANIGWISNAASTRPVAFGGELNAIAGRSMSVLSQDWSKPAMDPFGLPTDWVPPADASLVGGTAGEPSYQYYLRSAEEAAQEATNAVQQAISSLQEEVAFDAVNESATAKAATISTLERQALCGELDACDIGMTLWAPTLDECGALPAADAGTLCIGARDALQSLIIPALLATSAIAEAGVPPSTEDVAGSEFERTILRQWAAVQSMQDAVSNVVTVGRAAAYATDSATVAFNEALTQQTAAQANFEAEVAAITASDQEAQALEDELNLEIFNFTAALALDQAAKDYECAPYILHNSFHAGFSFPNVTHAPRADGYVYGHTVPQEGEPMQYQGGLSFSWGSYYAQQSRCEAAKMKLASHTTSLLPTQAVIDEKKTALSYKMDTLSPLQQEALVANVKVADAQVKTAETAKATAFHNGWTQVIAALSQAQQAQNEVLAASIEFGQAEARGEQAIARAEVERDLTLKELAAKHGLERQYRNYDMWRAQALLESARRLAVAARRAIESRFVLDLSEIAASQAFVDSPSVWADDIYASDLSVPTVVGLSAAPDQQQGIYPNQILDYVGNLERFVQGYTATYPTSVALPDTEVLVLPGPELVTFTDFVTQTEAGVDVGEVEVLAPNAAGWTFYCATTDEWYPHPGGGQVPLEDRAADMCDGGSPSKVRLSFTLDPWARLNESVGHDAPAKRHNVRWRRLAVNLVGTGIRACAGAANEQQCFSESFLRFQLAHVGPAWSRGHDQAWRSFDLPTASIEDGKALATEEWLEPIANTWTAPFVSNVARGELSGRPVGGAYTLEIDVPEDVQIERIEQVQLLVETEYWVGQQ